MILKTIGKIVLAILLIALAAVLLVLAFLFVYPSVGSTPDKRERERLNQRSDHFSDGQFRNEHSVAMMDAEPYPSSDRRRPRRLLDAETPSLLIAPREEDLSFTWLGHSSFLLQLGKITILVDPVLSGRASPVGFAGPKRFSRLPLTAEELPEIDVLFLSHDHYDSLDLPVPEKAWWLKESPQSSRLFLLRKALKYLQFIRLPECWEKTKHW